VKDWCLLEREDEALDFTHVVINLGCAYGLWEVMCANNERDRGQGRPCGRWSEW
jgi:hypothetical protein